MDKTLEQLFDGYGRTLSVPEVSTLLGMSKQGVYHWLHSGTIKGHKVGSSWFILTEDLKSHLDNGSNIRKSTQNAESP